MNPNQGKSGVFIILIIVTICMMITSSVVLIFKVFGKEKIIYTLESLGIIKNIVSKNEKINDIKEEIYEFPYLKIFQNEENNLINNLNQKEKIIYYRIKKVTNLNNQEIMAIIDLTKKLKFRYDYFISAANNYNYPSLISNENIYSIIYPKYANVIDTNLSGKTDEYKIMYLRGIYFHHLTNMYNYDMNRVFTEYNMGNYEAEEYYRRNGSYVTYFSSECIENIRIYEDIYRSYLKSII